MSLFSLLSEVCLRVRFAVTTDEYGNETRGAESTVEYPCRLEQQSGTEVSVNRNTQIADWVVYLPPDADVTANDVIRAQGSDFEVTGPPLLHKNPMFDSHKTANLVHVS